ncbi:WD repeat-containing protein 89 [Lamellibrachia satsuma]|nr:WD repeat-containing protein 89 [Lamellibrachia satsuma]
MRELTTLHLAEKSAISLEKTEPEYILHIDSQLSSVSGADTRVAATSSENTVRTYTRQTLGYLGSISGHTKTVTGVKFAQLSPHLLYTSSLDGTVRCWDTRDRLKKAAQVFTGSEGDTNALSSFDVSCDDRLLCTGTEATDADGVFIYFWDTRKPQPLGCYSESHHDDITQVCFHPQLRDSLLTGSTDGLVCVFDVSQESEDDALQGTLNSESSVSQIGWCGERQCNIYCTTHIETLHVWHSTEFDIVTQVKDVRDAFQGEKKLDYIVDCFQLVGDDRLHVMAGTHSGCLHLLRTSSPNCLEHVSSLDGGHSQDVRCLTWDPQTEMAVTGGEDSMLCLWLQGQGHQDATENMARHSLKAPSKIKLHMKKSAGRKSVVCNRTSHVT